MLEKVIRRGLRCFGHEEKIPENALLEKETKADQDYTLNRQHRRGRDITSTVYS